MPDLTAEEKERLDNGDNSVREAKGEIVIALNPIFTDQIDTKFIEFPIDTNRRLVIAAGGHNKVTSSMQTLMEWMLRDLSAKRYKTEFNEENLPYMLGLEKYVKQNRKKTSTRTHRERCPCNDKHGNRPGGRKKNKTLQGALNGYST